jgi:RNA polymerase sigma-32 factor
MTDGKRTQAKRASTKAGSRKAQPVRERERPQAPAQNEEPAEQEGEEAASDDDDDVVVEVPAELVEEAPVDSYALPDSSASPEAKSSAITHFDPLQAYLHEIQRHPLLTPEEEHALAVRYAETGDVDAAAKLVSSNLRLVVKIAYEYRRAYRNIMDLIQEGNIGLMQAVKRYDPYRGVKLSSYAAWWIRAYILRFVLNNWRLVKLGTTQAQRKLFFNLNKEKARLTQMGIEPTPLEIAQRLNVEESEVIEMDRRLASREASLDAPVGDSDGRAISRVEMMRASSVAPDIALAEGELNAMLKEKIAMFRDTLTNPKDIAIFDERLVAEEPLTLQDLGERFGISRERVRQLEARLMSKLREFLRTELGEAIEVS